MALSAGAGSWDRPPRLPLKVGARGKPQLQQGRLRPDTKRDFSGKVMRPLYWGLYTPISSFL